MATPDPFTGLIVWERGQAAPPEGWLEQRGFDHRQWEIATKLVAGYPMLDDIHRARLRVEVMTAMKDYACG